VKRRLTLGVTFALLCGGETLSIRVYDLAHTPAGTIEHASETAGQLLAEAGVKVTWEMGAAGSEEGRLADWSPGSTPDQRDYLVVRLVQGPPTDVPEPHLGYALPNVWRGAHATVYYDRVEKLFFSTKALPRIGSLVGAAMAHEIGHVLLGSAEHSPEGVMKASWGLEEFRLLTCKKLHFTPDNAAALRAGVVARLGTGRKFATCPPLGRFNSVSISGFRNCNWIAPL
jgi:hypothetical protein